MRQKICFDEEWIFIKEDPIYPFPSDKASAYDSAKTERALWGPASIKFDIKSVNYKVIDLPHDYVIEEKPSLDNNEALGFYEYKNAWYIKKFVLAKEDENKRIAILFDGVATRATVYVNGCLMKHNYCGYTSFEVDITDVAKFDEENTIAVYVDTQHHEGWWYEGGGIYRHVWLLKSSLVSVDLWGVFAKPVLIGNDKWSVKTECTIRNDYFESKTIDVVYEILDKNGNLVTKQNNNGKISCKDKKTFKCNIDISNPNLWSPESPYQYVMRIKVLYKNDLIDLIDTKFGFRTFKLIKGKGFFINGKQYKIKGLCGHADFGLTGKAVPDNIHRYKVSLMKEMGANGYRTSHYPQAAELMDALDENGFIVMNETRWFESTDEGKAQLEMLIKRDRNRPSVFFWSIGNEEPLHNTIQGRRISQSLIAYAKKLDNSRIIMTAVTHSPETSPVYEDNELIGINYNWESFEKVHKKYPNKLIISSENGATGTTRGHYFDDVPSKALISAYDHDINELFRSREFTWKFIYERDWIIGGYQWTSFEHRGEGSWPRLCSQSGAIDLFMQKKDAFYQNQSYWKEEPMVHLLPHWNFKGHEGEVIKVCAYSNVGQLELFLNGVSQGVRNISRVSHGEWAVKYVPGVLEVVAYQDGKIVAKDTKITTSSPYKLMLELQNKEITPNGKDIAVISCYIVDKDGNEVYDAENVVSFSCNELGSIYSTGSDVTDHSTLFSPIRKMRAGRIGVALKVKEKEGELKVYAKSDGLIDATLSINLKK